MNRYMRIWVMYILFWLTIPLAFCQSKFAEGEEYYEAAQQAYRSEELNTALEDVSQSLQRNQSAKAYYLQGLIFEALDKDLRAVSAYEAVLRLDPSHREALFQKALIYLNHGDPGQALEDFNRLIEEPGSIETKGIYFQIDQEGATQHEVVSMATLEARLFSYRGQSYEKLGKHRSALKDYSKAIRISNHPDYYVNRALLYSKLDSMDKAVADLRKAVAIDPEHQVAWYNLSLFNPSVELPGDLLKDASFAPTLGLLASRAMEEENYALAKKYFDQAISSNNQKPIHYINRGRVLLKMEQHQFAREDFLNALELDPEGTEALYLIGNTYFYEENYEAAIAYYNQFLTIDPGNGMVWFNAAMAYLEQKEHETACHYLSRAHTLGMTRSKSLTERYCK